jgi:hypothetical protein
MGVSYLRHINMSSFIDSLDVGRPSYQAACANLTRWDAVGRLER